MPKFDDFDRVELAALIKEGRELRDKAHELIAKSEELHKRIERAKRKPTAQPKHKK